MKTQRLLIRTYAILPVSLLLAACSSDDDTTADFIKLADGVKTSVVYPRDSYSSDKQIVFSTNGPWKAEITEMSQSPEGEWISLWKNQGDSAGVHQVGVKLTKNITEGNRTATVLVTSGTAQQPFYIFQRIEGGSGGATETKMSQQIILNASEPSGSVGITCTRGDINITGYLVCSNPIVTKCGLDVTFDRVDKGNYSTTMTIRKEDSGVASDVLNRDYYGEMVIYFTPQITEHLQADEVIYLTVTYTGS